ncbi:hypothetical protein ACE41A_08765 [Bacillus cytotoxicus]|uniref:hypothetical protein n=1 Tax=Bacillus cytotoxicus TaxID=580165 RepID=UPI0035C9F91E
MLRDACKHQKIYQKQTMMSNPPKMNWICKKCGEKGITIIGSRGQQKEETYEEIEKRFNS